MLTIYGTDDETHRGQLPRPQELRRAPAVDPDPDGRARQLRLQLNPGVQIFGRKGDDRFALDDNSAILTIDGGQGDDSFQIGQMFVAPRVVPQIPVQRADDVFAHRRDDARLPVERHQPRHDDRRRPGRRHVHRFHNGSNLTLNGDSGNDSFSVRAFALAGSSAIDPNQKTTNVLRRPRQRLRRVHTECAGRDRRRRRHRHRPHHRHRVQRHVRDHEPGRLRRRPLRPVRRHRGTERRRPRGQRPLRHLQHRRVPLDRTSTAAPAATRSRSAARTTASRWRSSRTTCAATAA